MSDIVVRRADGYQSQLQVDASGNLLVNTGFVTDTGGNVLVRITQDEFNRAIQQDDSINDYRWKRDVVDGLTAIRLGIERLLSNEEQLQDNAELDLLVEAQVLRDEANSLLDQQPLEMT